MIRRDANEEREVFIQTSPDSQWVIRVIFIRLIQQKVTWNYLLAVLLK
jgi:hypothetical protein